jgi:[acyl-carrier-protein] S-malonyltransferase
MEATEIGTRMSNDATTTNSADCDICLLCPGQGAQAVGMGKDLADASPVAREIYQRADSLLGQPISDLCFNGPSDRLNRTEIAQAAIFTTSVASYAAGVEASLIDPQRVVVLAGLSLGEYTALHLAQCFSFEDGLRLVAARGRHMEQAALATPGSMLSLVGADEATVQKLCQESAQGDVLIPANFNAPGQIVVSGAKAACDRLALAAEAAGFRAVPLNVAGAFHSPLMRPADQRMAKELDAIDFHPLRRTVYANVTAQPHTDGASAKKLLVEQIVGAVRWDQTMALLAARPELRFIELAPGRVLAGLMKRQNRRIAVESLATAESLPRPGRPVLQFVATTPRQKAAARK